MRVSVLIPVYGVEKYIGQCAESLFGQTYKDVEYVFVDDCTPDDSVGVLRRAADRFPARQGNMHIVVHDHNRGSGAARLTAMAHATGDFVMFVDGDDFVPADAIERLVERQLATGADMVDGAADVFAGGKFSNTQPPYKGGHYAELLIIQNVVPHRLWARLIRRSVFTEHGISFTEGVNQAEDYGIMPRVAFYASRAWTDSVVYHYRMDREGTFTDGISHKHVASYLAANRIILDFFRDKCRQYRYPLYVGLVNASYHAVRAGMTEAQVNAVLGYRPKGLLCKLAAALLSHKPTVSLARLEYLVLKRLYLSAL